MLWKIADDSTNVLMPVERHAVIAADDLRPSPVGSQATPTDGAKLFQSSSYSLPFTHRTSCRRRLTDRDAAVRARIRLSGFRGASLASQRSPASTVTFDRGFQVSCA